MPIRLRAYKTTPAVRAENDRQSDEMLEQGIIPETDSPWSAPVLLVKKANGDQRMVIDFRKLNTVTVDKFQTLPTMDEIFDCMAEKHPTIFSSIDLFSGYYQIKMEESSKKYIAFSANGRHLEMNRPPIRSLKLTLDIHTNDESGCYVILTIAIQWRMWMTSYALVLIWPNI